MLIDLRERQSWIEMDSKQSVQHTMKAWGLMMCHLCEVCGGGPCAMIGIW